MAEYESVGPLRMLDDGFVGIDQKAAFADIVPFIRFWLIVLALAWAASHVVERWLADIVPDFDIEQLITTLQWLFPIYFCLRIAYMIVAVRYRSYKLDELLLHVKYGVFTRTHQMVPRDRVQYTSISRSFIQRAFELATLVIHTAGTKSSSVSISQLRNSEAERLQEELLSQLSDE